MLNKKMISLTLLSLAVCSLAVATDYQTPKVLFKGHSPATTAMVGADTAEHMKVEGIGYNDRQIASEEESDREPSSLKAEMKKKAVAKEEEKTESPDSDMMPKPWMYRTEAQSAK